jgi:hypothetical protein
LLGRLALICFSERPVFPQQERFFYARICFHWFVKGVLEVGLPFFVFGLSDRVIGGRVFFSKKRKKYNLSF